MFPEVRRSAHIVDPVALAGTRPPARMLFLPVATRRRFLLKVWPAGSGTSWWTRCRSSFVPPASGARWWARNSSTTAQLAPVWRPNASRGSPNLTVVPSGWPSRIARRSWTRTRRPRTASAWDLTTTLPGCGSACGRRLRQAEDHAAHCVSGARSQRRAPNARLTGFRALPWPPQDW